MLTLPSQLCIRSRIKPRFLSTRESPFTHTYRQYLKCEVLNGEPHTSASFAVCPAVSPVDRRLHPPALTEIHSEWSEEEISPHLCCFYFIFSPPLHPFPPVRSTCSWRSGFGKTKCCINSSPQEYQQENHRCLKHSAPRSHPAIVPRSR